MVAREKNREIMTVVQVRHNSAGILKMRIRWVLYVFLIDNVGLGVTGEKSLKIT